MIFNSISNEYNSKSKLQGQSQHLRRLKMIESQRVTYLPSSSSSVKSNSRIKFNSNLTPKRSPILGTPHILQINSHERQRKQLINEYPATYSTIGQINRKLADSTNYIQYKEALKRNIHDGYSRDNRSYSSHIRRSHSRQSLDQHPDRVLQTQYTLNPIKEKVIDQPHGEKERSSKQKNGSGEQLLSKPIISSKLDKVVSFLSPSNWKLEKQAQSYNQQQFIRNTRSQVHPQSYNNNQNIRFTYGKNGLSSYDKPNSRINKPMFNPNHHYFPISQSISSITRKPILDNLDSNQLRKYSQQPTSDFKNYSRSFPEPQRQTDEEIDRFFDMDFKAGKMVETKIAQNLTKYQQNKIQSPFGLAQLQGKKSGRSTKGAPSFMQNLLQKLKSLDGDGKMVVLGLMGIAVLLVILQTIQ